jgi:adenylate cyclase
MRATAAEKLLPAALRRPQWATLAACALALLLVFALTLSRPWHALEYKTFDVFTALTAPHQATPQIVILAIDEPTFHTLQRSWPFPRSVHARLLQRLSDEGAVAVGMDILFAEPSVEAEDSALERAVAGGSMDVVLASIREKTGVNHAAIWTDVLPLPRLLNAGALAGDAGVEPDDDFVVRRAPVWSDGFARRLAESVAQARGAPLALHRFDWIGYRGPRNTFDTRSYHQALEPGLLPPGYFKDKIVLVGRSVRTATELARAQTDQFNSPFGTAGGDRLFPGVELQATLVDNYLSGSGVRSVSEPWTLALCVLLMPLMVWGGRKLHPGGAAALTAGLVLGIALLSWWLFAVHRLWWPPLLPATAALAVYAAAALVAYVSVRRRARYTRAMLSQYLPPAVVSRLIESPELMRLGGEAREVTLMFTDLANFTTLSEQLSAEQTVEVLTGYFNAMTPIVLDTGGTVDKFIGDAVMAFWGAPLDDPQHAEHAVLAAMAMQRAMQPLAADLVARGLPPIRMRIGLHTGRVVVGNVGSEQRFSYTAIGDAVNLAARLEDANKAFGTGILLSAATAAQLPPSLTLRALDDVVVKGKSEVVRVFTPCHDTAVCDASAAALEAFYARNWDGAARQLAQVLERVPGDPAALRLLERIAVARESPPGARWSPAAALDKI